MWRLYIDASCPRVHNVGRARDRRRTVEGKRAWGILLETSDRARLKARSPEQKWFRRCLANHRTADTTKRFKGNCTTAGRVIDTWVKTPEYACRKNITKLASESSRGTEELLETCHFSKSATNWPWTICKFDQRICRMRESNEEGIWRNTKIEIWPGSRDICHLL